MVGVSLMGGVYAGRGMAPVRLGGVSEGAICVAVWSWWARLVHVRGHIRGNVVGGVESKSDDAASGMIKGGDGWAATVKLVKGVTQARKGRIREVAGVGVMGTD